MLKENDGIYGRRLKEVLEEKDVKQSELAKRTGITEATISNYISNKQLPKLGVVEKIADTLNISVDYLLGLSDIKCYYYNEDYLDEDKLLIGGNKEYIDLILQWVKKDKNITDQEKVKIIKDLILDFQMYLRDLDRIKQDLSSTDIKKEVFALSIKNIDKELLKNTEKLNGLCSILKDLQN